MKNDEWNASQFIRPEILNYELKNIHLTTLFQQNRLFCPKSFAKRIYYGLSNDGLLLHVEATMFLAVAF